MQTMIEFIIGSGVILVAGVVLAILPEIAASAVITLTRRIK
jgi:hypothetical protein